MPKHVNIVDGVSIYEASEAFARQSERQRCQIEYTALNDALAKIRAEASWHAAENSTALFAVNPGSEGQQRFMAKVKSSFDDVATSHYMHSYVSLPPGLTVSESSNKPTTSLASRIAFIAGLMVRHPGSHVLVVSHAFELYEPLEHLARRLGPKGRVGLAYFGSLLDFRWKRIGLVEGKLKIKFLDLEPYEKEVMGVDLANGQCHLASDTMYDNF